METIETKQVDQLEVVEFKNDLPVKEAEYKKIIAEKKAAYSELSITGIADKEGYKLVDAARKDMKNTRVGVEKYCKSLRDYANAFNKSVSAKEKEIVLEIEEIETQLKAKTDAIDAEKERIEKERIAKRLELIRQYSPLVTEDSIKNLSDDLFNNMVANAKEAFEIEQKRIADEQAAKKAEEERLAKVAEEQKIAAEKLEKEQAAFKAEQERVAKENEAKAAEIKAQQDAIAKQQAEAQAKIEAEKKNLLQQKKESRINKLKSIGMFYDGGIFTYEDMTLFIDELMELSDENFAKQEGIAITSIITRKNIAQQKEEESKKEKVENFKKRLIEDGYFLEFGNFKKGKFTVEEGRLVAFSEEEFSKRLNEVNDIIKAAEEAVKAEQERIKKEAEAKEAARIKAENEAKRKAELAPDKDKLKVYATSLKEIKAPSLTTNEAQIVANQAYIFIQRAIDILNGGVENLQ